MLESGKSYRALYDGFSWSLPDAYSIAWDCCDQWAQKDPDRPAIVHEAGDGTIVNGTYSDLQSAANRLANSLLALGIGAGDRVAILLPQRPETAITHIACYKIGAVAVPLASLFGVEALSFRLRDSDARAIVTDAPGLEKVLSVSDLETVPLMINVDSANGANGVHGYSALVERASDRFQTPLFNPDQPAMMI